MIIKKETRWECSPDEIRVLASTGLVVVLGEEKQEYFGKIYISPILQARRDIDLVKLGSFCPNERHIPQGACIHQNVSFPRVISTYIKESQPRGTRAN